MSVTINNIGTNSRQIIISGETGVANIISNVNTALTSMGWTLFDTVTSGSMNMFVTKVYAAANNDSATAPTTKYMIIRYSASKGLAWISCAESWNATTHVATNECFIWNRNVPMGFQYSNCTIYIWATARYAAFMSVIRGVNGPWQGVFEFEREAVEDTAAAGYPCFGWTSSVTIANPQSHGAVYSTAPACFSVPRTRNGYTGWGAAQQFIIHTGYGSFPPTQSQIVYGTTAMPNAHCGTLSAFGSGMNSYIWDSNKKAISSLKLSGASSFYSAGRIYGLKVTNAGAGNTLDIAPIPIDANGFFSNTGTLTNHFVLPLQGGPDGTSIAAGSNQLQVTSTGTADTAHTITNAVMVKGRFLYCAGATGYISKLDLDTNAWSTINLPNTTSGTYDLIYDGGSYIYISCGTLSGLTRLNINDDTMVSTGYANGLIGSRAITMDDNYIYVTEAANSTTCRIVVFDVPTFTQLHVYSPVASAAAQYGTVIETIDCNGTVVALLHSSTATTSYIPRVVKVTGADGTGSVLSLTTTTDGPGVMWYDGNELIIPFLAGTTSSAVAVNPSSMTISNALTTLAGGSTVTPTAGATAKTVPFRGGRIMNSQTATTSLSTWNCKAIPANTTNGFNTVMSTTGVVSTATVLPAGPKALLTDGCSVYAGVSAKNFVTISGIYDQFISTGLRAAVMLIGA